MRKQILGVTLLEVMLVLAIASMIILMSVKYYKTATSMQQTAALLTQVQAIASKAESLAVGDTGFDAVTTTALQDTLGGASYMSTPWGPLTATGAGSSFVLTYPGTMPVSVKVVIDSQLTSNPKFSPTATGFVYDSTQ